MAKISIIYRQIGHKPDMSSWAQGVFGRGYFNELHEVTEFSGEVIKEADLVAVAGGLCRYNGINGQIMAAYREVGIPVVICEFGRLIPNTVLTLVNKRPFLPHDEQPSDRAQKLGFMYEPKPCGEKILVCGQSPQFDQLLIAGIKEVRKLGRRIIYRPHPSADLTDPVMLDIIHLVNEVSFKRMGIGERNKAYLQEDFDQSYAVMTHSSIVAINAIMRGLPLITHEACVASELATPLERATEVSTPTGDDIQRFLNRFAYTVWGQDEIRDGECIRFLERYF